MNYPEAVDFLYSLRFFGTKLGLENTVRLAKLSGNPHRDLQFIHVAGTNGKGSTCAFLESIYRASGLRTGLFTSPHLVSFTERIQVNRIPISESDVVDLAASALEVISRENQNKPRSDWDFRPTFFEVITIMALQYFSRQNCDLVLWETGLGGRLDATNIVTPLASVITNVQMDHEQWLGHSLAEIAAEKAGIIKPGAPVVTACAEPEALKIIQQTSDNRTAPLFHVRAGDFSELLDSLELPVRGPHQKLNAACALKTVEVLQERIPVSEAAIVQGLQTVHWAGRLQLLRVGDKDVLLDGAHNPDGAKSLAATLKDEFSGRQTTLIIGLFKDKAWQRMCQILMPLATRVFLVPLQNERALQPPEIIAYCRRCGLTADIRAFASTAEALNALEPGTFTVVAGSLHLIGEAIEHLGASSALHSERGLNEWNAGNETRLGRSGV